MYCCFSPTREENCSIHDTCQGSAAHDTSWSFFQLFLFVLFLSLPLLCEISSPPLFLTLSTCSAPLDPDATLSLVPEAAVIELSTDYGSHLLYSCQSSCQKQWIKIKSEWIITTQVKRYHRNIFSFHWVSCGIKSATHNRFIFSYPESYYLFSSCKQSKKRWGAWSVTISSLFTKSPQQEMWRRCCSFTFWTLFWPVKSNRSKRNLFHTAGFLVVGFLT